MISLAITVLLCGMVIATALQNRGGRLLVAILFVGLTLAHEIFFSGLQGFAYYASAALFDLMVIIGTRIINPVIKLVLLIQRLCIISIVTNGLGYYLWYTFEPPTLYNLIYVGIYLCALIILVAGSNNDVGSYSNDSRLAYVRRYAAQRLGNPKKDRGEL